MKRWRAIPVVFRIALILQLVAISVDLSARLDHGDLWFKLALVTSGLRFASEALFLFGAFELSRLLVGRAGHAAKLAAMAWGGVVVMSFVFMVLQCEPSWMAPMSAYLGWIWLAIMASIGVFLAAAAWRAPGVAVACGLVWIASHLPVGWFSFGGLTYEVLEAASQTVAVFALLGLALAAVGDVPEGFTIPAPQRARTGLTRTASSLWLRIGALIVVPVLMVVLVGGDGHNAGKLLGYATAVAGAINFLAFTLLGLGALDVAGSQHPEVRRWPFLFAAIASLWCGGVMLAQVPMLYMLSSPDRSGDASIATTFAIALPLVATTSMIAMAIAIGGFADRLGHQELAARGQRTALQIGMLQLGVLAITNLIVPEVHSAGTYLVVVIGALVCGVVATINLARLANDASTLVEPPPMAPTAKVV